MMHFLEEVKKWLGEITEIALLLIALGIAVEILFGNSVPFFGGIITNLTAAQEPGRQRTGWPDRVGHCYLLVPQKKSYRLKSNLSHFGGDRSTMLQLRWPVRHRVEPYPVASHNVAAPAESTVLGPKSKVFVTDTASRTNNHCLAIVLRPDAGLTIVN